MTSNRSVGLGSQHPLARKSEAVTVSALECGALEPIATSVEKVTDGEIEFQVHVIDQFRRKPRALEASRSKPSATPISGSTPADFEPAPGGPSIPSSPAGPGSDKPEPKPKRNPFLPYDPRMFVAELGDRHVLLLNKFPVTRNHVLVVTREFAPQERRLEEHDFVALAAVMWELGGIAYFNSAYLAGASQPHRHLQLIPFDASFPLPIESLLNQASLPSTMQRIERVPFNQAVIGWAGEASQCFVSHEYFGQAMFKAYTQWLADQGWAETGEATPYNLLMTNRWMMAVPRTEEQFAGVSLNAMAFAGTLLVKSQTQFKRLVAEGLMEALCVAAKRPST